MKIAWSQLYHLPVQTESGQKVGLVEGVTVDIDAHSVASYEVKPAKMLTALFSRTLLISPAQVVSISSEIMIVKDSVAAVQKAGAGKTRLAFSSPDSEVTISERNE
jgi:sporulation protein YlmC with PRC-barrel domain